MKYNLSLRVAIPFLIFVKSPNLVPILSIFLMFSKSIKTGRYLDERLTFGDIGATILKNFGLEKPDNLLGKPIEELFE